MKFSEYIKEEKEVSLLGMKIGASIIDGDNYHKFWHGNFKAQYKGLTTLKGSPQRIGDDFDCSHNKLKSLKYGPKEVNGHYYCYQNELTSLEGAPDDEIIWNFSCNENQLKSLKGAPRKVAGNFYCAHNKLTSLEGAPEEIGGNFSCPDNKLKTLKDVHKIFKRLDGYLDCRGNPIKSHVLGLLLIPGLQGIFSGINTKGDWSFILNGYIGKGRAGIIDAQNDLIEAGLEEYAQL